MHTLLVGQLRRCFGFTEDLPPHLVPFVSLVDAVYLEADNDRAMLEATIESTTDALLVVDMDGRIVRMNRKFVDLWRIPEDILTKRNDARALAFVLKHLEDPQEFTRKQHELNANPEAQSFDTLRFKDRRVFERYSVPHRVNGVVTGRVWIFRDVTSRLRMEEQLRQSQKMEAIGLLAGGVAHDFNNMLTVISGHAELMDSDQALSASHRDDLTEIRQAARRAARLTQQLLAFGRKQILRPVVLDLNDVVRELRPMLVRLIGEDIQIDFAESPHPALITADRGQFEQILMNLVVNARDAMSAGGRITLRVANIDLKDEPRSRARGGAPGPHVLFSVCDTGAGISPDVIDRVFEPFYTTKEAGKGTGLGLATVYGIVRQSGGFIEVKSVVGAGTTFEIFIPAVDGQIASAESVEPDVARANGSETVLVVEDEDAVRLLIRRTLERRGYTVLVARSGRDALAQIFEYKGAIALVVTDVVMPQMGGPEFVRHLRIARPHVPVLYVSGYTDDEVVRRGVVQSETTLLEKPFTTDQLTTAVRKLLDGPAR